MFLAGLELIMVVQLSLPASEVVEESESRAPKSLH